MDRRLKLAFVVILGACAPLLAACTPDTPETEFSWDANDHLRHAAITPAHATAHTYIYDGDNYAVPALKPRPDYVPSRQQQTVYNGPGYQPSKPFNSSYNGVFAWPGSGKIISGFGTASSGERNDGINIAMPMGAPIKAAASGTVSYSGDALKDYGNLLLIKHDGGYVTAYAHADQLLVHNGDVVAKGQVIAYAGRTGDVTTPQLHFEIRRGTTPVDPDTLLSPRNS